MSLEREEAAPAWQYPRLSLTALLPQLQPFRDDPRPDIALVFRPDQDEESLIAHRVEQQRGQRGQPLYVPAPDLLHRLELYPAPGMSPWVAYDQSDLLALLAEHAAAMDLSLVAAANKLATVQVQRSDQGWRWHPRLGFSPVR